MYDTLYYRSNLSDKQLNEIATYFKTCLIDGNSSVQDIAMMKNFLDGITKGHKNLVYAVERMKVVGICLYACAPTSLNRYKHVDITDSPAKAFLITYALTAPFSWHRVITRIESIVAPPDQKSVVPIGRILELKDSRDQCKAAGDYYISESGHSYVLCGDGNFVLLNKEKDDKDQLQGKENPGSGCSEGRIIYGRRDEFKYSTGRHCDQASAEGQRIRTGGYKVISSVRSPKVHEYEG